MSTVPLTINVPRIITRKVRNLRWLVRGYVALEGVAAILVTAGICFWIALGIDWFLEPTPALRVVMWGSVLAIVGYVAWKKLFSRIFTRLPDSSLALLVERTFPNIDQSLVTSIEMAHQPLATSSEQRALYTRTCEEAARRLAEIPLGQVFRYRPLLWTSIGAALLSASMVVFALAHAETFDFWLQRMRLSPTPWPRTVNLQVVGMEQVDGEWVVNVARDDNYELHVEASLADQFVAPEQVEIRYQLVDGRKGRDSMTQVGNAIAGQDATQAFRYEFKNLTGDIRFDLVGGDDRVGNLRLHVVERPQIVHTTAECVYPKYLGWEPQSLPFSGRVELPYGSQVRCSVEVNKPLLSARAYDPSTQQELAVDMAGEQAKKFTFTLGDFRDERVLLVDLRDTDSVSNREPYRILFSVVPDEVPEVSAQLRGIGSAITPQAVLPIVGTLVDDHGNQIEEAGPSCPVEVVGIQGTPSAGDDFNVVEDEARAREISEYRRRQLQRSTHAAGARGTLEQMFSQIKAGEGAELPVVVKGDVQGSVEAILGSLQKFETDEAKMRVLHSAVGGITESDVILAKASGGLIIGFNVRANPQARDLARRDNVDIRYYSIIYDVIDDMKKMLGGRLAPEKRETQIGYAEIRQVFSITKAGKVAGCMVTEGEVRRGAKVRLLRDNVVIHEGSLSILKRFKDDVREVVMGQECGMSFANYQDIREGDQIECFQVETIARSL